MPNDFKNRIIAVDLGAKRIGIAVCDELRMTARGVATITRTTPEKLLGEIEKLIADFDAVAVVIGLPLNFDGTESKGSTEARAVAEFFQTKLAIPVHLQDERLTSRAAEEILREQGFDRQEIKKLVDMEAAAIILRDFLEQLKSAY